ncbi:MAG: MBL fold metallo-hydrolase, partial [Methanoregula sp.]|nr:MBL fold metallo-hydrolase [Methanoregula sp.]
QGGNTPLVSLSWQPVPGAPGAQIYPLIRKLDTISSNAYLIQTDDVILLIDPGGLAEQAAQMALVIEECRGAHDRPVFVFLTHAHIDHFLGAQCTPAFAHPEAVVFSVQETGAAALERGDGKLTQADLLGQSISPSRIGLHLLTDERSGFCGVPVQQAFSNGATISIIREQTHGGLAGERIEFGPGPSLVVYHTPGHSPDSICIRMGGLLFIGDVLFAANPGIAGICGWDQSALIHSLDGIESLVSTGEIVSVLPGHGRVIATADAGLMIAAIRSDARALENIAELNRERAIETAAFAVDCMEQVNELFTIIAGRLYYVSYVLEELGEDDMAADISRLIKGDVIDELLEAFRSFADEHHKGGGVSIHLALKAGQVIARLQRSFEGAELAHIIDPALVRRAARLLSSYTTMLRGFCPPRELSECDLVRHLEALVTGLSVPACSDNDLLSSDDDDSTFIRLLLSRIGMQPLLCGVAISFSADENRVVVAVDRDDLTDLVTYILEDLVGTGANAIALQIACDVNNAIITFTGTGCTASDTMKPGGGFLGRLCDRTGGTLSCAVDGKIRRYAISIGTLI